MGKPNWACAACGMYSSRKSSVKRHIQNIHAGNANFVSFVDYLVGRNMGLYWPCLSPTYQKKEQQQQYDRLYERNERRILETMH